MKVNLRLTGYKAIDDVIRMMPVELTHRVLQAAHADAAKPLVDRAKTFSPYKIGKLEASIGVVKSSFSRAASLGEITIGPRRGKGGNVAHILEYGAKRRNRGVVKAKPFMAPAWESTKATVLQRINESLGRKVYEFMKRFIKNA